jgi:hypothetical protein
VSCINRQKVCRMYGLDVGKSFSERKRNFLLSCKSIIRYTGIGFAALGFAHKLIGIFRFFWLKHWKEKPVTSSAPINNTNIGSATYMVCVKRWEFAGFTAEKRFEKSIIAIVWFVVYTVRANQRKTSPDFTAGKSLKINTPLLDSKHIRFAQINEKFVGFTA